jgi:hypothetical protein
MLNVGFVIDHKDIGAQFLCPLLGLRGHGTRQSNDECHGLIVNALDIIDATRAATQLNADWLMNMMQRKRVVKWRPVLMEPLFETTFPARTSSLRLPILASPASKFTKLVPFAMPRRPSRDIFRLAAKEFWRSDLEKVGVRWKREARSR